MSPEQPVPPKPYTVLGAGSLLSSIQKDIDPTLDCQYRFTISRMTHRCTVSRYFRPLDIVHLVKMCRLLAVTFIDDG